MKKTLAVLGVALACASNAWAQTAEMQLLHKFARCDAGFFNVLKEYQEDLDLYAPIEPVGAVARFQLTGNLKGEATVDFTRPLVVNGIRFKGFFSKWHKLESTDDANNHLQRLEWGFAVDEHNTRKIAQKLPQLRLRKVDASMMQARRYLIENTREGLDWKVTNAPMAVLPGRGSVEKSLILQKYGKQHVLHCVLEGYAPAQLIKKVRPDLPVF